MRKCLKRIIFGLILGLPLSVNVTNAADCNAIFTPEAYELLKEVLGYVTIAVPILLIILCSSDLIAVVTGQDENVAKKAWGRLIKRFIAGAIFFFIPLIIRILLGIDAIKNGLNLVDDPLCGIQTQNDAP